MYRLNISNTWHICRRGYATRNSSLGLQSSLLPLVQSLNNLTLPPSYQSTDVLRSQKGTTSQHYYASENLVPILLEGSFGDALPKRPLGFLRPMVLQALHSEHRAAQQGDRPSGWTLHSKHGTLPVRSEDVFAVSFSPDVNSKELRTRSVYDLISKWKSEGKFTEILAGWSNEEYPVYLPSDVGTSTQGQNTLALSIERAALPLFGFPNFGTFLIGYCRSKQSDELQIWVSRRSKTKKTFPGLLDVMAGGGMSLGESPLNSMVREAVEEATLPSAYIFNHSRSVGCVTFSHRNPQGWLLPGLYYTYEIELPSDLSVAPCTNIKDGEVDNFQLIGAQECLDRLSEGEFKPSSALAIIDFLARHGLYTPEMDSSYASVLMAIRRDLGVPIPR